MFFKKMLKRNLENPFVMPRAPVRSRLVEKAKSAWLEAAGELGADKEVLAHIA